MGIGEDRVSWAKEDEMEINGIGSGETENWIKVAYITDQSFAMPTCISIVSMITNKNPDDRLKIYVVCDGVSEGAKERFRLLNGEQVRLELMDVHEERYLQMFEACVYASCIHVTGTALYKLGLAELLKNEKKILYLDGDTLVQKSLRTLYDHRIEKKYVAAVDDMLDEEAEGYSGLAKRIGLRRRSYFNSGVMLLNLEEIRLEAVSQKLVDYREQGINYFMDQDAFNAILGEKRVRLPFVYNFLATVTEVYDVEEIGKRFCGGERGSIEECLEEAVILHLTGKRKPWKYNLPWCSRLFFKYYDKSPYEPEKRNLVSPIKELSYIVKGQERCIHDFENLVGELEERIGKLEEMVRTREFVVPYERIKRDCRLILYGAGKVGRSFYKQLTMTGYCQVVLWADKNGEAAATGVELPEKIAAAKYDYILVAIRRREAAMDANRLLVQEYAVDESRILHICDG